MKARITFEEAKRIYGKRFDSLTNRHETFKDLINLDVSASTAVKWLEQIFPDTTRFIKIQNRNINAS